MLNLLLSRYGLSDESLFCIDSKPSALKSGQADGVKPRTLEVFKTLGISDDIENEACQMWEFAFWNSSPDATKVIERTRIVPEVIPPSRFPYEATIHQGRIERILETDLLRYSNRGIVRDTRLVSVRIDEDGDSAFPVLAELETSGVKRVVRSKHLVGADGAHSIVRQSMGLKLEGQSLDHIWGLVDLVADTNFPDMWAAYQIGQRVSPEFIVKDSNGLGRVFIVGDGAGQGMNVSMIDSYNLAWKLAYQVNGLTPETPGSSPLLDTYQIERHANAQQLIDFDRKFSTIFSGQLDKGELGLSHSEFVETSNTGNGFTSGCGVEYPDNMIVSREFRTGSDDPVRGDDYLSGVLRPGRCLLNVKVKRHADGCHRDIHDDLSSTGRFRTLCLTSTDLLHPDGASSKSLHGVTSLIDKFPASLIETIVMHPRLPQSFEWDDIPGCVKQYAEMRFYNGYDLDDAYSIYGVDSAQGALVVVRPDGYVGIVAQLRDVDRVDAYLGRCMRRV